MRTGQAGLGSPECCCGCLVCEPLLSGAVAFMGHVTHNCRNLGEIKKERQDVEGSVVEARKGKG